MAKNEILRVKDTVYKLQLILLEGIKDESKLVAAGTLISRDDYKDIVTERTIAGTCGYPLCTNSLPSERPQKGRYHISLSEHKIYDLQETYMYCSSDCLMNSRAFTANLQEDRISEITAAKLNHILKLFEGMGSDSYSAVDMGKNGDLGLFELKIRENTNIEAGEVSLEEWIGPPNAIDGYVPRSDKNKSLESHQLSNSKKGSKDWFSQMNFTSDIITQDEYSIAKAVQSVKANDKDRGGSLTCKDVNRERKPMQNIKKKSRPKKSDTCMNTTGTDGKVDASEDICSAVQSHDTVLRSSLRATDSKKAMRSVSWADEKTDFDGQNLEEYEELKVKKAAAQIKTDHSAVEDFGGKDSYRFSSAEACAEALSLAAEAVASGHSYASDAVSEAGLIILPSPPEVDNAKSEENLDIVETDSVQLKWPPKPEFPSSDLFDSENSLIDSPPEGFNLSLSPFSTMFMALFAWISSSSLAYIYGKDESFHEEYLSINGREYPRKIILADGLSKEIKQTLSGCLARALPTLVTELRLNVSLSTLERGLGCLLGTMSFTDPIPSLRMKQWHVIILLFLDALSVSRIPSLTQNMLSRNILFPKVLEGAHISTEEFEIMKDLLIPLGRAPQFSAQSGG